jgi:orotidine-5'-phosphate decarboxylase
MISKTSPIIVALDHDDVSSALSLVKTLGSVCDFYKVGSALVHAEGEDLVRRLVGEGKKVFLDLKFHDIPNTVERACRQASRMGVTLLTIHLSGVTEMIKAALNGAGDVKVLGVSVLTSINETTLKEEIKALLPLKEYVEHLVGLGLETGIHGIVCSARETAVLRSKWKQDFLIVNPGIRLSDDELSDQKRAETPSSAMKSGASYLVIGRPISEAKNPLEKFQAMMDDINA